MRPQTWVAALFIAVMLAPRQTVGLLGPHGADLARQIEAEIDVVRVLAALARLVF